jgi:hypothetical protein
MHKPTGVPMFYQPDGARWCFHCHHRSPAASRRHYRQVWSSEPGTFSMWPADLVRLRAEAAGETLDDAEGEP